MNERLIGTWKLVAVKARDLDGGPIPTVTSITAPTAA